MIELELGSSSRVRLPSWFLSSSPNDALPLEPMLPIVPVLVVVLPEVVAPMPLLVAPMPLDIVPLDVVSVDEVPVVSVEVPLCMPVSAVVDDDVVGAEVSADLVLSVAQAPSIARPGVSRAKRTVVFLVIGVSWLRRATVPRWGTHPADALPDPPDRSGSQRDRKK